MLLLDQVPPVVPSVYGVVAPTHTVDEPEMGVGDVTTFTVTVV